LDHQYSFCPGHRRDYFFLHSKTLLFGSQTGMEISARALPKYGAPQADRTTGYLIVAVGAIIEDPAGHIRQPHEPEICVARQLR
jgi:hypothetical protein